ncbi:MAG TPA: extracellular solute-binding protein [Xanthobacteraceae bacterium]|jgi:ABC-type Fe3+ transport system substrate-binding protein
MCSAWAVSSDCLVAVAAGALMVGASIGGVCAQSTAAIEAEAQKEGAVVWYSAMRSEHIELIAEQFRLDFPKIKIETIFLTSPEVAARVIMEQRGRRFNADIISGPSASISQLKLQKKLTAFTLPAELRKQHLDGASDPQGYWAVQYVLSYPITYNTQMVAAQGLAPPRSFEDLTASKWQGKFAISQEYYDWYQGLADYLGRDKARALAQRLAANKPLIRATSSTILQLLEAGEYAATFHSFGYAANEEKAKGKPVDFINAEPLVATMQTGAIALNPPHPNAAKLFQMWMASTEMQQFVVSKLGRISTHKAVANIESVWNPKRDKIVLLDPDKQVRTSREFQDEYRSIFGIASATSHR